MKSTITFEHGETTCAVTPGVFCRFLRAKRFGTDYVCGLYDDEPLWGHDSGEYQGWLARCPQCLNANANEG